MNKLIALVLTIIPIALLGQSVSGIITDESGVPISYAYVISKNNNKIVYSDENGRFKLSNLNKSVLDTLNVISLSYKRYQTLIDTKNSNQELRIKLEKNIIQLPPVVVNSSKKMGRMQLGFFNKKANRYLLMNPGQEIAVLFHSDTFPSIIKTLTLLLNNFSNQYFSIARINVYEFDSLTKLPGEIINQSNIIIRNKVKNKQIEIDLSSNNVIINRPYFCVGIEFVKNEGNGLVENDNVSGQSNLVLGSVKPQVSKHFIREITKDNSFKWRDYVRENIIIGLELKY